MVLYCAGDAAHEVVAKPRHQAQHRRDADFDLMWSAMAETDVGRTPPRRHRKELVSDGPLGFVTAAIGRSLESATDPAVALHSAALDLDSDRAEQTARKLTNSHLALSDQLCRTSYVVSADGATSGSEPKDASRICAMSST